MEDDWRSKATFGPPAASPPVVSLPDWRYNRQGPLASYLHRESKLSRDFRWWLSVAYKALETVTAIPGWDMNDRPGAGWRPDTKLYELTEQMGYERAAKEGQ